MKLKALLVFLLVFVFSVEAYADESVVDKVFATTIKGLSRVYVYTMNIKNIKAKETVKLSKMSDAKFYKRYGQFYDVIKDVPPDLRSRYGLKQNLSKQDAIKDIERVDKKSLIRLIDQMPDRVVIEQVKLYFHHHPDKNHPSNPLEDVHQLWKKMIQKV